MPKLNPPKLEVAPAEEEEENLEPIPSHPTWSGSISIGLVNIPVRAIPITLERKISFRMLHQKCKTPISYKLFCEEGDEVSKSEIAYGYKVKGHDYLVFDKKEIDSAKPVSSKLIELDKFVNFFQADPHYFERTWLLIPNNSDKPYALLRKLLEKTGMAAIGKVTMSTRERVVLIHYYQNAVVATTLRYPDDLDLRLYHDGYKERIEALITSKMNGEVAQVNVDKPKKPAAKSMMEMLRETAESLK
jgi:DNA end-binding protein Ku